MDIGSIYTYNEYSEKNISATCYDDSKTEAKCRCKTCWEPGHMEKIFSQRTPFDKIEASVTATLSTEAFRMYRIWHFVRI